MILRKTLVATVILASFSLPGQAQDVRINPFLPQTTTEEQRLLAEKERMRQAIREMMPEIRSMLMPSLEEQKEDILSEAIESVLASIQDDPALLALAPVPGADTLPVGEGSEGGEPEAEAGINSIPTDAKYVGCINGKALYRDTTGIRYFDESPEAEERCSL